MRVAVQSELDAEIREARQVKRIMKQEAWRIVRTVSFWLETQVKIGMPVDTGRARASWGHWTIGDLREQNRLASSIDAFYKEMQGALATIQGSNVEYVDALAKGSSPQAMDGWLDALADKAEKELVRLTDELLDDVA